MNDLRLDYHRADWFNLRGYLEGMNLSFCVMKSTIQITVWNAFMIRYLLGGIYLSRVDE